MHFRVASLHYMRKHPRTQVCFSSFTPVARHRWLYRHILMYDVLMYNVCNLFMFCLSQLKDSAGLPGKGGKPQWLVSVICTIDLIIVAFVAVMY